MDIKHLKPAKNIVAWSNWLASVSPVATTLISEMNAQAIPVSRLRAMLKGEGGVNLPPDLPGVYGFFTSNPNDENPLIKFGESYELFARLISHLGVKPLKEICPARYVKEKNSFSGDSSFRVKIARALKLIERGKWKKTEIRGEKTDIAKKINKVIDQYRVAWQPLLFGRKDIQTWVEWSNENLDVYRATQMAPHCLQARMKPAFDKSLFAESPAFWKGKLGLR